MRLLLEDAIASLPYKPKTVTTPTGQSFTGAELAVSVCGVSILRAGESMEGPLRQILPTVRIGKILIQRNEESKEKEAVYYYQKLPPGINNMRVLLLDPMLATGGSACAAIRCLIESGVAEENITFVNLVSCPEGVSRLFAEHPRVKLFTGMIDDALDEKRYIVPGLGDFGDLYFGTTSAL